MILVNPTSGRVGGNALENLGKEPGLVGIIFRKAQNKISNPSDLQRVIKMIADEDWSGMDVDIKGAIYERKRGQVINLVIHSSSSSRSLKRPI